MAACYTKLTLNQIEEQVINLNKLVKEISSKCNKESLERIEEKIKQLFDYFNEIKLKKENKFKSTVQVVKAVKRLAINSKTERKNDKEEKYSEDEEIHYYLEDEEINKFNKLIAEIQNILVSSQTEGNEEKNIEPRKLNLKQIVTYLKFLKRLDKSNNNSSELERKCSKCKEEVENDFLKCLICKNNYYLCTRCYENMQSDGDHSLEHLMIRFEEPNVLFGKKVNENEINLEFLIKEYGRFVHNEIKCDGCKRSSIIGLRFKCQTCKSYNLCLECYEKKRISNNHIVDHRLLLSGNTFFVYPIYYLLFDYFLIFLFK